MTRNTFRIAVLAILVNKKGEILIGSSPRDGGYKLPQGGLEENEEALSGVKRELYEELGINIIDDDIEAVYKEEVQYIYPPEDPYYIYKGQKFTVIKINYNDSMQLIPQDDEFEELYWINPSELPNFDVQFRLEAYKKALELCGLF